MSHVRKLTVEEVKTFINIAAHAYPGLELSSQDKVDHTINHYSKMHQEDPSVEFYGYERDGQILGGYLSHSYRMNLLGTRADVSGIGFVGVDLYHKKEQIAKELLTHYVRTSREAGKALTMLYPFRVDFYKQMGYGYGLKMYQYRITPSSLPKGPSKNHVEPLSADDKQLLVNCYNRFLEQTNGMCEKTEAEVNRLFANPHMLKVAGVKKDGQVRGYMSFLFKKAHDENFGFNDMIVREFIYNDQEALSEMLTFLRSQADQINRIVFHTQDESFYHLLSDPRNGTNRVLPHVYHESHVTGVGLMYRVVDTAGIFKVLHQHNFGGQTCKLKLTIEDTFLPENAGSTILHVENGLATVQPDGDFEVEVNMNISEFSSLLMGSIHFKSLMKYGLAGISDAAYIDTVHKLFLTDEKPMCTTGF